MRFHPRLSLAVSAAALVLAGCAAQGTQPSSGAQADATPVAPQARLSTTNMAATISHRFFVIVPIALLVVGHNLPLCAGGGCALFAKRTGASQTAA